MATVAELAIKTDTTGLQKGETALKNFRRTSERASKGVVSDTQRTSSALNRASNSALKYTNATDKAARASGGFANGARNISLQLSQVAQQGAATGNFLQAFAIQLPDILLSFGTLGILIGAAAGALAGPLVSAFSSASEEAKKFDDIIKQTRESLISVQIDQLEGAITRAEQQIEDGEKRIQSLKREIDRASTAPTARGLNVLAEKRAQKARELLASEEEIEGSLKEQQLRQETLVSLQEKLSELRKQEQEGGAGGRATQNELQRIQQQIGAPAERIAAAFERRNQVIQDANERGLITQQQYDDLRTKNAMRLQEDLTKIEQSGQQQREQILSQGQQAALSATGQLFGNLAAIAKEGGKEQFDEYKALASAQAAISAALAISQALAAAPPPLNIGLASAIGALTAVQIAKINQQEYQGARAMGGQVAAGNSYLVGENGPEVVTMGGNGFVTPNHALGGAGPQVTVVQNFTAGVTRAELQGVLPQVASAAKQATLAALNKGGTASQAVRRRA